MRRLAFSLAIFSLPFQLGYHFWPSFSFLAGYRIDYLSPTLYLSYLLIFIYILESLPSVVAYFQSKTYRSLKYLFPIALYILLNVLYSIVPVLSLISWFKLIFYFLFFISLITEDNLSTRLIRPLIYSLIVVLLLEITQLIIQSSVNGPAYILGERSFNLATPNTAKIDLSILGEKVYFLRPYSTFSHPNSLAGFLLVSFFLLHVRLSRSIIKPLLFLGVILTFSKSAIAALLIGLLYLYLEKSNKLISRYFYFFIIPLFIFVSLSPLLSNTFFLSNLPFDLTSPILARINLGRSTTTLIRDHWLLGTGLNNYLTAIVPTLIPSKIYYSTLQPVHSSILLALIEMGLLGLLLLVLLVKRIITSNIYKNKTFRVIVLVLLITSSLDHYWWTLVQNQLLLVVVFALYYTHDFGKNSD